MDYSIQPTHRPSFRRRVVLGLLMLLVAAAVLAAWMPLAGPRLPGTHIASRRTFDAPAAAFSAAEDWPRWRGPRGDAISREAGIVSEFPDGGPPQLWAADVGVGYSSPVASAGRVYLFTLNERKEVLT